MGVVYEAIQLNLSRKVALKILNEELAARAEFVQRFEREAKAAAALNHPNVVQVHDFCESQGWRCLIMEYVEGQDLSDYTEAQGKLSILTSLEIIEQAALALKAAHEKAIIHRDVKPSNLLMTREGTVKVLDLGLAKILTEASDLTLTGIGMGSPYFMAPEQASDARDVDHRADIYALGLTLLFLLTGKRPFDGNTPYSIVLAHANKPLPRGTELGTDLPAEVETLIRRMAAKDRNDRYADYDSLIADVRRVKAGYAPAFKAPSSAKFWNRKVAIAASVVFSLAAAAIIVAVSRSKPAPATAPLASNAPPAEIAPRDGPPPGDREPDEHFRGPRDNFGPPPREGELDERPGPPSLGQGRFPFPLPRLPRPDFTPLEDGPVDSMLAQVEQYAQKNPQNFRAIIDRYRQVLDKVRGTARAEAINRKLDDVVDRHQAATRQALSGYEAKMNEKLRAGKPQEAYDLWKDFPANLRTRESDQQIQQILERALPSGFSPK
jgi:serine/threonine protein kinase